MKARAIVIIALFIILSSSQAQAAPNTCGNSRAVQCQTGKGGTGNGFFSPEMNPRFNPNVNPRFNPQADPRFNPQADPRFNPKANPRFNPGATPCDLGISTPGKPCPKRR
jgi:hypothetical protein